MRLVGTKTLVSAFVAKAETFRASGDTVKADAVMDCLYLVLSTLEEILHQPVTVAEAAHIIGISPSQIRRRIQKGKLTRAGGGGGEPLQVCLGEVILSPAYLAATLADIRSLQQQLKPKTS